MRIAKNSTEIEVFYEFQFDYQVTFSSDFVDFIVEITVKCKQFFLFAYEQALIYQYKRFMLNHILLLPNLSWRVRGKCKSGFGTPLALGKEYS